MVYTAILREMRKELGNGRASEIFKRAIHNHGLNMLIILNPPRAIEEFKAWLLAFLSNGGSMRQPEALNSDEKGLDIENRVGNVYVTGCSSNNAFKITPGGVITEIVDSTGDGNKQLAHQDKRNCHRGGWKHLRGRMREQQRV